MCVHRRASGLLAGTSHVQRAGGVAERVLCMAPAASQFPVTKELPVGVGDRGSTRTKPPDLWQPTHSRGTEGERRCLQRQSCCEADARTRHPRANETAVCGHHADRSRTRGYGQHAQPGLCPDQHESGLVCGHHLHLDTRGMTILGGYFRWRQPASCGMVDGEPDHGTANLGGSANGD